MDETKTIRQKIAVRAVILHKQNVLIIRESAGYNSPNKGRYDLPGGKVNPGESLLQCLYRETMEECGLEIEMIKPIHIGEWERNIDNQRLQVVGIFYLCQTKGVKIKLGPDHDDFQWIKPSEIEAYDLIEPNAQAIQML